MGLIKVGLSYRPAFASWFDCKLPGIQLVEAVAEDFYKGGQVRLSRLRESFPVVLHTERLSLGTPRALNPEELRWFASLVEAVDPLWISDHVGFRYTQGVDLGFPNPLPLSEESLGQLTDRVLEVSETCGKPFLVENLTSHLTFKGLIPEPVFLNRLCEAAGCRLLLDVTSLFVNSRNHHFSALEWLHELDRAHIVQLHVGGATQEKGYWDDTHDAPIAQEIWELVQAVMETAPLQAVVLERDGRFPPYEKLKEELLRLQDMAGVTVADHPEVTAR